MSVDRSSAPPLANEKESANGEANSNECKLHISSLTRNVSAAHLKEIFGHFGTVKNVDLQVDPKLNISKGFAYVEYENADDASRGQQFMDGGQLDGNKIRVTYVLVSKRGRQNSPDSRGGRRSRSPAHVRGDDRGRRERPPPDDWRRGRVPGVRRSRSPDRRRERSPLGGQRAGPLGRRGPSPVRRRSPQRGGPLRRSRSRSRSPRRRGSSPGRGRGDRPARSRSRDKRRASRSRSPPRYRRRGRSSSPSSSPSPAPRDRKRSRSRSASSSSYSSRSRSSSYSSGSSASSRSSRSPASRKK